MSRLDDLLMGAGAQPAPPPPTMGRIVIYRCGNLECPAIVLHAGMDRYCELGVFAVNGYFVARCVPPAVGAQSASADSWRWPERST